MVVLVVASAIGGVLGIGSTDSPQTEVQVRTCRPITGRDPVSTVEGVSCEELYAEVADVLLALSDIAYETDAIKVRELTLTVCGSRFR